MGLATRPTLLLQRCASYGVAVRTVATGFSLRRGKTPGRTLVAVPQAEACDYNYLCSRSAGP